MIDVDILPARRRDFLSMYRELHRPHGVTVFTTSVWSNRFGGFGFQLARASKRGRFTPRQIALVSAVCPQLKLAEALWISNDQTSSSFDLSFEDWAEDCSLTTRERTVAQLVARGLKNPEIAALLGSSRLTVRNQIGAIFRKAGVSTRAELVFAAAAGRRCSAPSRGASARAKTAWLELVRSASG
jgi:DNA-binding CsgD family transcriptional regulator